MWGESLIANIPVGQEGADVECLIVTLPVVQGMRENLEKAVVQETVLEHCRVCIYF